MSGGPSLNTLLQVSPEVQSGMQGLVILTDDQPDDGAVRSGNSEVGQAGDFCCEQAGAQQADLVIVPSEVGAEDLLPLVWDAREL